MNGPATTSRTEIDRIAAAIRMDVVRMAHAAQTPHLASSLSCVEILVAAYFRSLVITPSTLTAADRDIFILGKGHAATALYATLAHRGMIPMEMLATYNHDGGLLPEHPSPGKVPGIEAATGSLGHGLSLALGMQLARRIRGTCGRAIVLMSDGECQEGSVWEAAMLAAAREVGSLTAIVDANQWQATSRTKDVAGDASLVGKWRAFGWQAREVDGHDIAAIDEALSAGSREVTAGRPIAIVAHTVKGKGVSFMEDDNNWHYRAPTAAEVARAAVELGVVGEPAEPAGLS